MKTKLQWPEIVCGTVAGAAEPAVQEGDFVLKDFRFASGETLPELRLHYRTLGTPQRDAQGVVRNAVLIMHGTGGTGAQFLRPEFLRRIVPSRRRAARRRERYFIDPSRRHRSRPVEQAERWPARALSALRL